MGNSCNCFDGYWGKRELKQLDKKKTRVNNQFAVIVEEHDRQIDTNQARRDELKAKRAKIVHDIKVRHRGQRPIRLTNLEQEEIENIFREMIKVQRRIEMARAQRHTVVTRMDNLLAALTHQATNRVTQHVLQDIHASTGLNLDELETARDNIDEADQNLSEIAETMHSREMQSVNDTDDQRMMKALMSGLLEELNSNEQIHEFSRRDTQLEMATESASEYGGDQVPLRSASRFDSHQAEFFDEVRHEDNDGLLMA